MPAMTKNKAVEALVAEIEKAQTDDLVEIHNELFPIEPTTEAAVAANVDVFKTKVLGHVKGGLEIEEVLDLWGVVFPLDSEVWYEEENETFHYEKKEEPVQVD